MSISWLLPSTDGWPIWKAIGDRNAGSARKAGSARNKEREAKE